jgi:Rrf2 family iron-sulfur cluster assembly transcriptional regulator
MAMVDLAAHSGGKPVSLAEVAERQGIKLNYLEQIFMRLRKAGLVRSVRGPGGGYEVARSVDELSIADIVIAADESIKMTRCGAEKTGGCIGGSVCLTHNLWEGLGEHIHQYLSSITLASVCEKMNSEAATQNHEVRYG